MSETRRIERRGIGSIRIGGAARVAVRYAIGFFAHGARRWFEGDVAPLEGRPDARPGDLCELVLREGARRLPATVRIVERFRLEVVSLEAERQAWQDGDPEGAPAPLRDGDVRIEERDGGREVAVRREVEIGADVRAGGQASLIGHHRDGSKLAATTAPSDDPSGIAVGRA